MAESILIGISTKILGIIASATFKKAYEKGASIWEARDELSKLQVTITTIQARVIDAEKKQEGDEAVKNWIQRLKGVLYDAEDLFDEVTTEDLLKGLIMEGENSRACGCQPGTSLLFKGVLSLEKKVRVCCSKLNPIMSRNSIAKRVKAIQGRLFEISIDMVQLGFVQSQSKESIINRSREGNIGWCSIGEKSIIGRDEQKNAILEMLITKSSDTTISDGPIIIAIDGIGGMGKTTLAYLIYNHEKVKEIFEKNRWFTCISKTSNEVDVLEKIYQSMYECGTSSHLGVIQLADKIKESIENKKYLLVLDDVWEDDHSKWENIKCLLSSGGNGSRIIVTTRLPSVAVSIGAVKTHNLGGLSEEDSWNLFKNFSFVPGYEKDPVRERLGRELLERCRRVPLAIRCMGSLLRNKTILEWEEISRYGLPVLGGEYHDEVMRVLKLSYDHLPSNLKQCFTYCSLFPKDYRYDKEELIYHWIAQGYTKPSKKESDFMGLLRMGFFQEVWENEIGEIGSCKMHDIIHDLALNLSGEESIMQSSTSLNLSSCTQYVSLMVDGEEGELWNIPTSLLNVKSIRSCILRRLSYWHSQPNLDQLCSNFKLLRSLTLSGLGIEHIPPSIGELKLVRYLDLSSNEFEELPDSLTNLVNLLVLNLSSCRNLRVWPHNFKMLIKLWSLNFEDCYELRLMPKGFGGINRLQYLSDFKVGKGSEIDVLNGLLKQLRDYLHITFCVEKKVEGELNWQLPSDVSLQRLDISFYRGQRIRGWGNNNCTSKLEHLEMRNCKNVKYLPPLSCLATLKSLKLEILLELEFVEEDEEVNTYNNATSNNLYFPCLKVLVLYDLPKLTGWRRKVAAEVTSSATSSSSSILEFSHLSELHIKDCPNLKSFPRCPKLQELEHRYRSHSPEIKQELSSTNLLSYTYPSLRRLKIGKCWSLKKLHLASPHLQIIVIEKCSELVSIELVGTPEPSLRYLGIEDCIQLKSLHIEEHDLIAGLKEMKITNCPKLRLSLSETPGKRFFMQQGLPEVEVRELYLEGVNGVLIEQSLSSFSTSSLREITIKECKGPMSLPGVALTSLRECRIEDTDGIERLHVPSPHLQNVSLWYCVGLLSAEFEAATCIDIRHCRELKKLHISLPNALREFRFTSSPLVVAGVDWDSIPNLGKCSCISRIELDGVDEVFIQRLLSSSSPPSSIGSLTVPFTSLKELSIANSRGLKILNIESQQLKELTIENCSELKNVRIANPNALTSLELIYCPELGMIPGVDWDWDALTVLCHLTIGPLPPPEKLPQCLLRRQALGQLRIHQLPTYPNSSPCNQHPSLEVQITSTKASNDLSKTELRITKAADYIDSMTNDFC